MWNSRVASSQKTAGLLSGEGEVSDNTTQPVSMQCLLLDRNFGIAKFSQSKNHECKCWGEAGYEHTSCHFRVSLLVLEYKLGQGSGGGGWGSGGVHRTIQTATHYNITTLDSLSLQNAISSCSLAPCTMPHAELMF
jgi:hypothetical protein